ncbi:MAG: hypothetical protein PHU23_15865, partial [Dehalococcoidales bacterium]|nr:hypothetical protein [Dehalococcoidales bacterium]
MPITYIITIIGLIIIGIFWYFNKSKKNKKVEEREKTSLLIGFIFTLIATMLGVIWAFNLANIQSENNEKQILTGLISQSIDELNLEINSLKGYPEFIENRSEEDALKMLSNNPQEDVVSVNYLISNQLLPKFCTQMGVMALIRLSRDKEKFRDSINNKEFELQNRLLY